MSVTSIACYPFIFPTLTYHHMFSTLQQQVLVHDEYTVGYEGLPHIEDDYLEIKLRNTIGKDDK